MIETASVMDADTCGLAWALGASVAEGRTTFSDALDLLLRAGLRDGSWDGDNPVFEDWAATAIANAASAWEVGKVPEKPPAPPKPPAPHYPAPQYTREEATRAMRQAVRAFLADARRTVAIDQAWRRKRAEIDTLRPPGSLGRRAALRQARAEMAGEHGADWKAPGRRVLLPSPAGIGKTTIVAAGLAELSRELGTVTFLTNLLANAEAVAAAVPDAAVVRGRLAPDPNGPGTLMCLRPDAVRAVAAAGLPITETLCAREEKRCPRFDECAYQRDQRRLASGNFQLFCGAHEHLTTPAKAMRSPDLVVVDERFVEKLAGSVSFCIDRLTETAMEGWSRAGLAKAVEYRAFMAKVREALPDPDGILAGLRRQGITSPEDFDPALDYLRRVEEEGFIDGIGPDTDDTTLLERLETYQKCEIGAVRRMLTALREEIALPRDQAHGVAYRPDMPVKVDGAKERQTRIEVFYRKALAFAEKVPVLALDASSRHSVAVVRKALGARLEVIDVSCERNVVITKVIDRTMSRSSMTGRGRRGTALNEAKAEALQEKLAAIVNGLAAKHGGSFFFTSNLPAEKAIAPKLGPDVMTGHFGGVRGSNEYRSCLAGANAGREEPPPRVPESIARAYWADDPEPLVLLGEADEYPVAVRCIRMRDGSAVPVEVAVHPDQRVQMILELFRERETEQNLDRLRLIHNLEPKYWYDVCSVPLDVSVDRIVTFDQLLHEVTGRLDNGRRGTGRRFYGSRVAEAIRQGGGVLPLSPSELVRLHPNLWKHKTSAERDVKSHHTRQIDLFAECGYFPPVPVRYRRRGQRGSPTPALVAGPADPDMIRGKLSARVGEITWLAIDSAPKPPEPDPSRPSPVEPVPVAAQGAQSLPAVLQVAVAAAAPIRLSPAAHLAGLARRLEAAKPPRAWGDATNAVRLRMWQKGLAAVREHRPRAKVDR